MDKYTKFILSIIAIGVLGLNYHLIKGDIISPANASSHEIHKIALCDPDNGECMGVLRFRKGYNMIVVGNHELHQ